MSYLGVSIKEAMDKINREWFLPAIQRPYVWGSRYDSERYICKLFDSLFRGYPIGTLIFWATEKEVAHREFLTNYHLGDIYKNVDDGLWRRSKYLVYDGQQRLQTLFSCLKYTFNNRVLVFDLLYKVEDDTDCDTGFRFIDIGEELKESEIKMNTLFTLNTKEHKIQLYQEKTKDLDSSKHIDILSNIDRLWTVFVSTDTKTLAYFSVQTDNEDEVNDVFERLNTGGIPLSKADLLYSKIKAKYYDFEANIMQFSNHLKTRTGLAFTSYDILQLIHLIVRRQSKINEKIAEEEIESFNKVWNNLPNALNSFFDDYLCAHFKISHMSIIRFKNPLLVMMVYFYHLYDAGGKFRNLSNDTLQKLDRFFIISQLNSWDLQTYTDNFARLIIANENKSEFPEEQIFEYVRYRSNREIEVKEDIYKYHLLFSLKITFPNRDFEFDYSMPNRFNPELDHIFPRNLKDMDEMYQQEIDVIWNMQAVKGEVNNLKSNYHPKLFFSDAIENGKQLNGSKYFSSYDCIPSITSSEWDDYKTFISKRRERMIETIYTNYRIKLIPNSSESVE
jgi:hypothetical protein